MAKNNLDSFYTERGAWTDYVCSRKDFTHAEFRVAYFIASKTNPYDGCMWYTVKRIAVESFVSLSMVTATIEKLDKARLIMIGKRKIGRQTVSYTHLTLPTICSV